MMTREELIKAHEAAVKKYRTNISYRLGNQKDLTDGKCSSRTNVTSEKLKCFHDFLKNCKANNTTVVISIIDSVKYRHNSPEKNITREHHLSTLWSKVDMKYPLVTIDISDPEVRNEVIRAFDIKYGFPCQIILQGDTILDKFMDYGRIDQIYNQVNSIAPVNGHSGEYYRVKYKVWGKDRTPSIVDDGFPVGDMEFQDLVSSLHDGIVGDEKAISSGQ